MRKCLIAAGTGNSGGYRARAVNGKNVGAHVLAWIAAHGEVPPATQIHHKCENPACVEITHLEALPTKDHVLLGNGASARNHRKTHCPRGHPYDEANTYVSKTGGRQCRTCTRDRTRAWQRSPRGRVNKAAYNANRRKGDDLSKSESNSPHASSSR